MAVYAVGDIQGCYDPLRRLLDKIGFDPARDTLWCVGDLVNRGPDSLGVLRFVRSLGAACVCVLGNHDLHLLGRAAGEGAYRRDTLEEVLAAADLPQLVDWLRSQPLLHHDEPLGWCMVHAGLHPAWTLQGARSRAAMVEERLRGNGWREFCRHLHHQQFPAADPPTGGRNRDLFGAAVLTRARFCTADGVFNWDVRSNEPGSGKEKPWFAHGGLAWSGQARIVYGHWAARGLVDDQPHVVGLDSGCVWGGQLSVAKLDSGKPLITQVGGLAGRRPS